VEGLFADGGAFDLEPWGAASAAAFLAGAPASVRATLEGFAAEDSEGTGIPGLRAGLQGALSDHIAAQVYATEESGEEPVPKRVRTVGRGCTPPSYESNETVSDAFAKGEAHSGRPRKPAHPEGAWLGPPPAAGGELHELTFREAYTPVQHVAGPPGHPAQAPPLFHEAHGFGGPAAVAMTTWALEAQAGALTPPPPPHVTRASRAPTLKERRAGIDAVRRIPELSRLDEQIEQINQAKAKRSSKYRGVTRHRRSGRWEAHIWVKETGKQVYLGGYEEEGHAAEAYDVAALKCKGKTVKTNFPIEKYSELLGYMDNISLEELVMAVRRQSQGFARGSSRYRGVTRHPGQNGRWEARIGTPGSKHVYLGLYADEAEAAKAYDRALVKRRGPQAATNFSISEYKSELKEYHLRQQKQLRQKQQRAAQKEKGKGKAAKADKGVPDPDPHLLQQATTKLLP